MVHANALLTPRGRLALAVCVVEEGWSLRRAAERFQTSPQTAGRWAARYRARDVSRPAIEAMADRPSRPKRSPGRTPARVERRICHLRRQRGWGPARIGHHLRMHPSTVGRVLRRRGMPPLAHLDLATRRELRRSVRRYEHPYPGSLIHVDIKKLGRIPDGGGHRAHGRAVGRRNSRLTTTLRKSHHPVIGYGYVHSALDDHSRLVYSEVLADEQAETAAAFWARALDWFTVQGIRVERVLTDNGSCYRSRQWAAICAARAVRHKRTRPYRPQTNGKIERFHRTLLVEWAYIRTYRSERTRLRALRGWLHIYNHHRTHTALGGHPPASRVTNLSGQNT
ncbi:MAG TPA: IS481 family transposase [Nocardioidaceae bacterium]